MATPFMRFPGSAGNNVWTEDTNVIDADTANIEQTLGAWENNSGMSLSLVSAPLAAVFGNNYLQCVGLNTGNNSVRTGPASGGTFAVAPSTEYAVSAWVAQSNPVRNIRFRVLEWNAGGSNVDLTSTDHVVGTSFGQLVSVITTRSDTVKLSIQLIVDGTVPGEELYVDAVSTRVGTDPTFLPSLDIQGSLFVSEVASVTPVTYTYTPGSSLVVGDGYAGDVSQWALHDGADASAPIVAQVLATDALRALPL